MKDLSQTIVNKLEKDAITPRSRSYFLVKNYAIWGLAVLSMIVGSLATALVAYNITSRDWDIYHYLHQSFLGFAVGTLPYAWIAMVLVCLLIAIREIEHSRHGYKYSPFKVVAGSVLVAVIFGIVLQLLGTGAAIDTYFGNHLADYQTVETQKERVWNQPQDGLFSGVVQSVNGKTAIVSSVSGEKWQVDFSSAIIRGRANITTGSEIKIIGTSTGANTVRASEIRPWGSMGQGLGRGKIQK